MSVFNVELKKVVDDSYDIEIGYNLSDSLINYVMNGQVGQFSKIAIITDSNVRKLYAEDIQERLKAAGLLSNIFSFEAGELSKTRDTKESIEDLMISMDYKRDSIIIAIGGGVVSDIAGFIAGTYCRGIPYVTYATTYLAAADASIGGKTAVDTTVATNLIGLFYQPKKVFIDIATWETLDSRQMINGMAETIKHACMADANLFEYLENNASLILEYDRAACEYVSDANCRIKYQVVMKDEQESGLREILNLGHTLGRAVETASEYRLLHGEAVAIGLVFQARLAQKLGYMTQIQVDRVMNLIKKCGLSTEIPDYIDRDELFKRLYTDKKVKNGRLRFVLQNGIGNVIEFKSGVYTSEIDLDVIKDTLVM